MKQFISDTSRQSHEHHQTQAHTTRPRHLRETLTLRNEGAVKKENRYWLFNDCFTYSAGATLAPEHLLT